MVRLQRVIVPDFPHHVTQRGNRRQRTFFNFEDYGLYKQLLTRWLPHFAVDLLCYCLMPNHVHLLVIPSDLDGLARAMHEVNGRYAYQINQREDWRGCLWQGRFYSCPLANDAPVLNTARYILQNPVRAALVERASLWEHSNALSLTERRPDEVANNSFLLDALANWGAFLDSKPRDSAASKIRESTRTGRPYGSRQFVETIEKKTGRNLLKQKPGRRAKAN